MRKTTKQTASVWDKVDSLNAARNFGKQLSPDLGFTVKDYAKRYGINYCTASIQIRVHLTDGKFKLIGKCGRLLVYDVA